MIARAADGSVQDGLSILDQAMASGEDVDYCPSGQVYAWVGWPHKIIGFDGGCTIRSGWAAMTIMADLYRAGADPQTVLQDLLDITHWWVNFDD